MNRRAQLFCAWCGPAFAALFVIGGVFIGRWMPPFLYAFDSAEVFQQQVVGHLIRVRLSSVILMMGVCCLAPWGAGIAAQTRQREGRLPTLSYAQLMCTAAGTVVSMFVAFFWAIIGYRPESYGPHLVQFGADLAYFYPLFSWPIFSIWCVLIALTILLDESPGGPIYPRWVAYANLWAAVLFVPSALIVFFKDGPFAWHGLLGLYIPIVAFFLWILMMSFVVIKNIYADHYTNTV